MNGQLFGDDSGDKITIPLKNDEAVTAIEYYNFPDPGHMRYGLLWRYELCGMSIFTIRATGTRYIYGPYNSACWVNATERVYGNIPAKISFQDFLAYFSFIGPNDYLTFSLPPWTYRDPKDFNLPDDYKFAANLWGNLFYKPYGDMKHTDAKAQCELDGTSLATPKSDAEKEFLFTLIPDEGIWIGLEGEMFGRLFRESVDVSESMFLSRDVSYTILPVDNSESISTSLLKFVCSYNITNSLQGIIIYKAGTFCAA